MIWIWVYLGIALAGLVMLACFAIWLWRKAVALLAEAGVLMERADELFGLLDQIQLPDPTPEDEVGATRRRAT